MQPASMSRPIENIEQGPGGEHRGLAERYAGNAYGVAVGAVVAVAVLVGVLVGVGVWV